MSAYKHGAEERDEKAQKVLLEEYFLTSCAWNRKNTIFKGRIWKAMEIFLFYDHQDYIIQIKGAVTFIANIISLACV